MSLGNIGLLLCGIAVASVLIGAFLPQKIKDRAGDGLIIIISVVFAVGVILYSIHWVIDLFH